MPRYDFPGFRFQPWVFVVPALVDLQILPSTLYFLPGTDRFLVSRWRVIIHLFLLIC